MSFLVTRLWMPVPSTSPTSIACSWAILRTRGKSGGGCVPRWTRPGLRRAPGPRRAREAGPGRARAPGREPPAPVREPRPPEERERAGPPAEARRLRGGGGDGCGRRGRRRLFGGLADHADDRVDRDGRPFLDLDLEQRAGDGGGDLGVHLVGRDLEDRLVALDLVADLLQPLGDRPLGDRLSHLGHDDFGGHGPPFRASSIGETGTIRKSATYRHRVRAGGALTTSIWSSRSRPPGAGSQGPGGGRAGGREGLGPRETGDRHFAPRFAGSRPIVPSQGNPVRDSLGGSGTGNPSDVIGETLSGSLRS